MQPPTDMQVIIDASLVCSTADGGAQPIQDEGAGSQRYNNN